MIAKPGFKWSPLPATAAEQIGTQRFAAKMQKAPAFAGQAGKGNDGARKNPGLSITAKTHFADPCLLAQGYSEASGFLKSWCSEAFALHFHMKRICASFLQSPCKGALHL